MLVQTSKDPNWKHGWGFKGMDAQELGFVSSAGRVVYYPVESLPCGISNGSVLLCCFHYKYYIQMTNFRMHVFARKCFSARPYSLFLELKQMFHDPYKLSQPQFNLPILFDL